MRIKHSIVNFIGANVRLLGSILNGFIVTPILVRLLGPETFGSYRLFLDIIVYFDLVELGFYSSMLLLFNRAIAQNSGELHSLTIAAKSIYRKITLAALLLFFVSLMFIGRLINVDHLPARDMLVAYTLFSSGILFMGARVSQALLEAGQKSFATSIALTVQNLLFSIFAVLFAWMGYGIVGVAFAFATGQASLSLLIMYQARTLMPQKLNTEVKITQSKSALGKIQWPVFLLNLTGKLSLYSDNLIIAHFFGAKNVTAFFLSQRLLNLVSTVLGNASSSVWAGLGDVYAKGDMKRFHELMYFITRFLAIMALIFLVPVYLISGPFMQLWVGPENFLGYPFIMIVALNIYIQSILNIWGWCYSFTQKMQNLIPFQIISALLNIVLSILFTYYFDFYGPVMGTLVTYLVFTVFGILYFIKRELSYPAHKLFVATLVPMIYFCAIMALSYFYLDLNAVDGWGKLTGVFILAFSSNGLFVVLFMYKKEERDMLFGMFRRLIKR